MGKNLENVDEEVIAEWSVHLLKENPRRFWIFMVFLIVANALLVLAYGAHDSSPFLIVLGNLILIGSVCDYLFPMRFKLTDKSASCRNFLLSKEILWERVKNCYISEKGIKLSPLDKPGRMENFRGFVLYFNNNRDEILNHVRRLASNRQN